MWSGVDGSPPYLALDITYSNVVDGKPDYTSSAVYRAMRWDEWIHLPIREWDEFVQTPRLRIRVPTVVICPNYARMVTKEPNPTKSGIKERDNNTCQYSGVKLTHKTASVDHIKPRRHGGKDTWDNMVLCHRDINSKKGDKFNHEVGLKLLRRPPVPRPIPLCATVKGYKHPDHHQFN
jgi:5-methylcytosine-specific restriction endonuclease McrA